MFHRYLTFIFVPTLKTPTAANAGGRWFYLDIDYRGLVGRSIRQSDSTFCTSSLKDFSAVRGSHSLSEAVLLLSLTLFGLIGSKHLDAPPCEMVIGSVMSADLHVLTQ